MYPTSDLWRQEQNLSETSQNLNDLHVILQYIQACSASNWLMIYNIEENNFLMTHIMTCQIFSLPSATSQAFLSWEWWAFLISLSLKIFSSALVRNISFGRLPLRILPDSQHIINRLCYLKRWTNASLKYGTPVNLATI